MLTSLFELYILRDTKVSAAKDHGKNYIKVRLPLVRHLLCNSLLRKLKTNLLHSCKVLQKERLDNSKRDKTNCHYLIFDSADICDFLGFLVHCFCTQRSHHVKTSNYVAVRESIMFLLIDLQNKHLWFPLGSIFPSLERRKLKEGISQAK